MLHRIPGLMFEAVEEPDTDAGGGEPEPAPEDVIEGEQAVEPEPAAAAPDYSGWLDSDEGQQAVQAAVRAELEGLQQQQEQPQEDELVPPDPWTSDDYQGDMAAYLAERDRRLIEAVTGAPAFQHAEQAHATEWVDGTFAQIERDLKLPEGEHLTDEVKQLAVAAAAGSRPPDWQPGMRGFDPGQAVAQHAKSLHTLVTQREQAAVERYKQQIAAGANGHQEPGVGGGGINADTLPEGYENWPSSKKLDWRFGRVNAQHAERL